LQQKLRRRVVGPKGRVQIHHIKIPTLLWTSNFGGTNRRHDDRFLKDAGSFCFRKLVLAR